MEIAACPRCASRDLAPSTIADGLFPGGGETQFWVCRTCSYRGAPLLFADAGDYAAFQATAEGAGDAAGAQGEDDAEDLDDEAAPAWAEVVLAAPAPGAGRARGTAVFVGTVGTVVLLFGLWSGVAGAAGLAGGDTLVGLSVLIAALVAVGVGAAFLRIAARQWRGTP